MSDRLTNQYASCTHLIVNWKERQIEGGITHGWWECRDCCHPFTPVANPHDALQANMKAQGLTVLVDKPGLYQLRAATRLPESDTTGAKIETLPFHITSSEYPETKEDK